MAVALQLAEIKSVFERVSSTDAELQDTAEKLSKLLYNCGGGHALSELQSEVFSFSIVNALLGIAKSSSNLQLLSKCLGISISCIIAL